MLKFLLSVEQEEVGDSVSEMMVLASCSTENSLLMTGVKIASCSSSASIATGTAIEGFVECTVPLYSPSEFTSHFRMSRESVQVIFTHAVHTVDVLSVTEDPTKYLTDRRLMLYTQPAVCIKKVSNDAHGTRPAVSKF